MFGRIRLYFDEKEINKGRQTEFDVAKGLAIIFMVLCHSFEYLSDYSSRTLFVALELILGSPFAAPVFMFCMGVGVSYTRKNQPADLCARGIHLLGASVLLGFTRDLLLPLIVSLIAGSRAALSHAELFFCVDILRFACLAFLFFALLKKLNVSPRTTALIALVFSAAGYLLQNCSSGVRSVDFFLGHLWYTHSYALFPFLNWFIFPAFGHLFAHYWKRCRNTAFFYRRVFPACWLVTALYVRSIMTHGLCRLSGYNYYGIGPADALLCMCVVMTVFSFSRLFLSVSAPASRMLTHFSRNITAIYLVHWIIIFTLFLTSQYILQTGALPNGFIIPCGILILLASDAVVTGYHALRARPFQRQVRSPHTLQPAAQRS